MKRSGVVVAYADGSGTVAELPSGCGVALYAQFVSEGEEVFLEPICEASWFLGPGSNNHAEVSAVRVALWISAGAPNMRGLPLIVRTDSMYAINMVTGPRPAAPGQKNSRVINATRLALVDHPGPVRFEHVKGHSGITGNVRADFLAGRARRAGVAAAEARARHAQGF